MTRRFLAYALCVAGMIGVYFAVNFLVTGISRDFGYGFVIGGFTMTVLLWLGEKVGSPSDIARVDGDFERGLELVDRGRGDAEGDGAQKQITLTATRSE